MKKNKVNIFHYLHQHSKKKDNQPHKCHSLNNILSDKPHNFFPLSRTCIRLDTSDKCCPPNKILTNFCTHPLCSIYLMLHDINILKHILDKNLHGQYNVDMEKYMISISYWLNFYTCCQGMC